MSCWVINLYGDRRIGSRPPLRLRMVVGFWDSVCECVCVLDLLLEQAEPRKAILSLSTPEPGLPMLTWPGFLLSIELRWELYLRSPGAGLPAEEATNPLTASVEESLLVPAGGCAC